jgi:SAM-dependent methyltransferase
MNKHLRRLVPLLRTFQAFGLDPVAALRSFRALPYFLANARRYGAAPPERSFALEFRHGLFTTADRYRAAGATTNHVFWQGLWAADYLYRAGLHTHVDVASSVAGFIAHILPFCEVTYVDLRPLRASWPTLHHVSASILSLPFADRSAASLSCLHVLEHIGLGRYGDPVDPAAHRLAAAELQRVLAPGGTLLFSTPVGRERLRFDAHRIFDPATIEALFRPLTLREFHLIPDSADHIIRNARFEEARTCEFGCGLFVFGY